MKAIISILGVIAALGGVLSCSRMEADLQVPEGQQMTFTASWADGPETKTAVQSDGVSIYWNPREAISLFNGTAAYRFVSTNTEPAANVSFNGYLPVSTGLTMQFHAVYPYREDNAFDGSEFTLTVPSEQSALAGTFADQSFPAIAQANGTNLSFYNVCGGAVFTVVTEGIRSVTFRSLGGESLVGTAKVSFNDLGLPQVNQVTEGSDVVVLTPPDGGAFEVGKKYYAVFFPQILSAGLSVMYRTDSQETRIEKDGPIQINRSRFGRLFDLEAGLEWGEFSTIPFADAQLKSLLVEKYDTDGDGELSPAEAAAVTSLEGLVPAYTYSKWNPAPYKSFDELRFFTSVTEIPFNCFYGWGYLKSIRFPESVVRIDDEAFTFCVGLTKIRLPESLKVIYSNAFSGCTGLTQLQFPEGLQTIYSNAFSGCTGLTSVEIPDSVTYLRGAFSGCSNLVEFHGKGATEDHRGLVFNLYGDPTFVAIAPSGLTEYDIPDGVTVVGDWVFNGCDKLTRIGLPSSVKRLERAAFHGCSSLISISIPDGVEFLGDYLFRNCTSLTSLTIPESVSAVGDIRLGIWDPVTSCTALEGFYGKYASEDHRSLIVEDTYVAVALASGSAPIAVPESVSVIGESAFYGATLEGITLPEGITRIETNAFCNCKVPSLTIPATVSYLGGQAFNGMKGPIYFLSATPPAAEWGILSNSNCAIFVPAASLEAYKTAEGWSDYAARMQAIPE